MAQLEESFESSSEDSYADVPEPPQSQTLLKTESLQRSLKRKTRSGLENKLYYISNIIH